MRPQSQGASKKRLVVAALLYVSISVVLSTLYFRETRRLALEEAKKTADGFLLTHRALRRYIEDVQKPEVYRLKEEGRLYRGYFSPKLMSSTYIARNVKKKQDVEREKANYESLYYKLAATNPRNPVNRADKWERDVLARFNTGRARRHDAVIKRDGKEYLYVAIPLGKNEASCMRCHGDPDNAPKELIERYGKKAGFFEKAGRIRACRVTPGRFRPEVPTDPDVQNSRIRLLASWIR
jgi:hypothetical protein